MKTALVGIPANHIADCWDKISHLLADACSRSNGKYESSDILRSLLRGDMQLWGVVGDDTIEAIGIGEIVVYPRIKIYRLLSTTGDNMPDWLDHIHGIENWARIQGCQDFEAIARPGWERVLKSKDYKKTHVILSHSLLIEGSMQ